MEEYGAELLTSRTAYLLSRMLILDVQDTWPKEVMDFYWSHGMDEKVFEKRAKSRPFNFSDVAHPIPVGYHRLAEGDTITLGGRK